MMTSLIKFHFLITLSHGFDSNCHLTVTAQTTSKTKHWITSSDLVTLENARGPDNNNLFPCGMKHLVNLDFCDEFWLRWVLVKCSEKEMRIDLSSVTLHISHACIPLAFNILTTERQTLANWPPFHLPTLIPLSPSQRQMQNTHTGSWEFWTSLQQNKPVTHQPATFEPLGVQFVNSNNSPREKSC